MLRNLRPALETVGVVAVLCLGLILVAQARRIQHLQTTLEDLSVAGEVPTGTVVPSFSAKDARTSETRYVTYGGSRPKVFYVFSPSCGWCQLNSGSVNSLAKQLGGSFEVIGLAMSDRKLPEFLEAEHITFPVYVGVAADVKATYRLQVTPETIVVSPEGKVLRAWRGAYGDVLAPIVERFFSVRLPPLPSGSAAVGFMTSPVQDTF